jgi:mannose-6-phosphate isomerase-like protein (cupin superfamily)
MIIKKPDIEAFDFDGLAIRDYTAEQPVSSSVAEITVPAGIRHRRAWSRRSDKYYYVLEGNLSFTLDNRGVELSAGDLCVVRRGTRFSYENNTGTVARMLLVHTPSFDLTQEEFEE